MTRSAEHYASSAQPYASKVPEVTLGFWIIKILATTLGETGGDTVTMSWDLGYLVGTAIFLSAFLVLVAIQIAAKKFHPFLYWSTIVASTTAGTTMADFATRSLGVGYTGGSLILFACLMAVLGLWYWSLGSISVATVNTPKVEAFYWAAITFSQTLGTALGDWIADAGLGYGGGALVFGAGLTVLAATYFWTNVSRVHAVLGGVYPDPTAWRHRWRFSRQAHRTWWTRLEPPNSLGGHRDSHDHPRSRSASKGRQSSRGDSGDGIGAKRTAFRQGALDVNWTTAAPAVATAFLSSLVEAVEALTIVLAVSFVRGWRPAGIGAIAGLGLLALIVLALGPLLDRVPLHPLQLVIGILLLLFGMRWLRKAILRAAGVLPLHDEAKAFASETQELRDQEHRHEERLDWLAGLASFKAVVLEGLEVVFIVIAVGAGRGLVGAASLGALAACLIVVAAGFALHRPLARVPENTLKFAVGVLLSSFGIFWIGEGLGVPWPGKDLAILAFVALFLTTALSAVALARRGRPERHLS